MVRVGGGWDTLASFLERHGGGEPIDDISPSDLLPMDTRPSESSSRLQAIDTRQSESSSRRRNSSSSPQSGATTPVLRRCMSSTPVSRRSSMSSPEPWMSGSSGYSSGSSCQRPPSRGMVTRRSSICVTSTEKTQIPVPNRRRSLAAGLRLGSTNDLGNRNSISGLNLSMQFGGSQTITPGRPTSEPIKARRYPNYLSSSQHITNRSSPQNKTEIARRTSLKAF